MKTDTQCCKIVDNTLEVCEKHSNMILSHLELQPVKAPAWISGKAHLTLIRRTFEHPSWKGSLQEAGRLVDGWLVDMGVRVK